MILDGFATSSIASGAQAIRSGALLGLPTETVYGLGADAENDAAIARIFTAKGRPADHPLIVHVLDAASVAHFAAHVPDFAHQMMQAFWPGPLTLILPRRAGVAAAAAGGHNSIGLRCPSHPVAQALLNACQAPADSSLPPHARHRPVWGIAAPSANQFGRVSPTTAAHVQSEFGADLLILDGGPCAVGIESTIVDCTRGAPVLLRPGAITPAQIEIVCGRSMPSAQALAATRQDAPRASGTLESHYAPNARVRLMDAKALQTALDLLGAEAGPAVRTGAQNAAGPVIAVYARTALNTAARQTVTRHMPDDAAAAARELFAVLRALDLPGVTQIWIETPPDTSAWAGVRDRLQRAAA